MGSREDSNVVNKLLIHAQFLDFALLKPLNGSLYSYVLVTFSKAAHRQKRISIICCMKQ